MLQCLSWLDRDTLFQAPLLFQSTKRYLHRSVCYQTRFPSLGHRWAARLLQVCALSVSLEIWSTQQKKRTRLLLGSHSCLVDIQTHCYPLPKDKGCSSAVSWQAVEWRTRSPEQSYQYLAWSSPATPCLGWSSAVPGPSHPLPMGLARSAVEASVTPRLRYVTFPEAPCTWG